MIKRIKAVAVINDFEISRDLVGRYGVNPRVTYAIYRSAMEAEQGIMLPFFERIVDCVITYDDGKKKSSKKSSKKLKAKKKHA